MPGLILNIVIVVGTAALSARLYWYGLNRRYRAFFLYLIFYTLQTAFMMTLDIHGGLYQKVYVITEPVTWVFYVLVVVELYSLVLADYQGLYTFGRWALMIAVVLALTASAISLLLPSHNVTGQSPLMWYYYRAERAIYFSLMVFLLTILFLLLQYPIALRRNIILHSIVYSVYFLCNALFSSLLSTQGKPVLVIIGYFVQGVTIMALGSWLTVLNPQGEKPKFVLRPHWMPGKEEDLVRQLNSLNDLLLRAARKSRK